ncbi:MAG TPA: dihydroneopterin aldolase [Armatimonadetes bacterium]|nr:dihydroneopterin aldolase [Armatimonadota bacterium]
MASPTDVIRLKNLTFYGYHGVVPEERALGQRFSVDVELRLDLRPAGETDDLQQTVDYREVYRLVQELNGRPFNLLEGFAEAIAQGVLARFPVEEVTVRVRKPSVPLGGVVDYAEVEIVRRRE